MNDLKSIGSYYCANSTIAKTLKNSPVTNRGFTLKVENSIGNDPKYIRQTLMAGADISMRVMNGTDNWIEWVEK